MDSVSEAVDYELAAVLGDSAKLTNFRLQPRLTIASNEMDDTSPENLENLTNEAQKLLQDQAAVIQTICSLLRSGRGSNMPATGIVKSTAQTASKPQ